MCASGGVFGLPAPPGEPSGGADGPFPGARCPDSGCGGREAVEGLVVSAEIDPDVLHAEELRQMYELHRDLGRRAMQKAMQVLDQLDPEDIPVNVAVQLLKFGADLERRALLGIEPDAEHDPFDQLAKAMTDAGR